MSSHIVTLADLQQIKNQIVSEMGKEISNQLADLNLKPQNPMLRSSEVRKILNCFLSKLETLMRAGTLPYVKVLGTNYFNRMDVEKLFSN